MDSETTEGNNGEGQKQVSSSFPAPSPPAPFRFQGGPQESPFAPPSALFTFEAGPVLPVNVRSEPSSQYAGSEAGPANPKLDLSPEFPPTNVLPEHPLPYPGYEADVERLCRLEREMEELKKVESDLQARLLPEEDKPKRRRSARLRSPRSPRPPPAAVADPVDGKTECRRLQL